MKLLSLFLIAAFFPSVSFPETTIRQNEEPIPLWGDYPNERPKCVKGIHLTSWVTGSTKRKPAFEKLFAETELNTAVIDIKEIEGDVYVRGVKLDRDIDPYKRALGDIESYLRFLKERGVFTIARIVLFKDQFLPKEKPEWAVKSSTPNPKAIEMGFDPDIWVDHLGRAWADPYNPHVWKYNIQVALRAAELGFQGIQFDYLRFPSDGNVKHCVYSKPHSREASVRAISKFLERAHEKLKSKNVEISIDVFGLVGSYQNDLGIGQRLSNLTDHIDVLSPMMYPSHYGPGELGVEDPISNPYDTIFVSVQDTLKRLQGTHVELRPFLQDFSIRGVVYTPKMVRDQIEAVENNGVSEWLLWNPRCVYTKEALQNSKL